MQLDWAFAVDLAVVILYLVTVIAIGLKVGKKENSLEDFSLGGRTIPWWAVLASIIAAETSAATFLGIPGEGYSLLNYSYLQMILGMILGRIIVAFIFIKIYYDLNVYSIYEFLEVRFGRKTRTLASATFLFTRLLASGARLYVAAIVLAVGFTLITGTQPTTAEQLLIYLGSIVFITAATALYTFAGGIKAVVWTDLLQASVMIGGALSAIAVLVLTMPAGWHSLTDFIATHTATLSMITTGTKASDSFAKNLLSILTTDYTIWAGVLGSTFMTLATHGTDQDMVQRMLTAADYRKSRLSLVLSGVADLPIAFIFITIGILLNLFYAQQPDPLLPHKNNEIFAFFILKQMPTGLRGLLVASIFATAMGSLSAALNALATSYTRDFHQSRVSSDSENVDIAKKATIVFALLLVLVAGLTAGLVVQHPESRIIPIVLSVFGYTYGSLLGVFLLGALTKQRGNDAGNCIAMLSGFLVVAYFSGLPAQLLELAGVVPPATLTSVPSISFPWRIMIGCATTFAVALIFRETHQSVDVSK